MVLGEVLQLNEPARPSARAAGTVELEHAVCPSVFADGVLHCLVFLHGRFGKLEAELQGFFQFIRGIRDEPCDIFFAEGFCLHAVVCEPLFHLYHTVGIFQVGDAFHGFHEF